MRVLLVMVMMVSMIIAAGCTSPPEGVPAAEITGDAIANVVADGEVPINMGRSSFTFEGYGPGKSHAGTFTQMEGTLMMKDGKVVGGVGIVQAASVKSDSAGLDNHLKNEDFFNVDVHPEIRFKTTGTDGSTMIGELTFLGVTKQVAFPYTTDGQSIKADFLLNTEPFGLSRTGIDKQVRITFTFSQ